MQLSETKLHTDEIFSVLLIAKDKGKKLTS